MTTQYTPILQLALPVTGELNGTWGDVVNDNITSMVEEAIAGLATISTWTTNAHTLTTADGVTDEARCAMLVLQTGSGGTALSGAGQIICPARTKLYVVKNDAAYAVTVKTSGGSGVAVAAGDTAFVFCDGTNVNACVTQIINGHITGNLTVDGNTTLGDASGDTVTINAGTTTFVNANPTLSQGTSTRILFLNGSKVIADAAGLTWDGTTMSATRVATSQVNITGQGDLRLEDTTGGEYVALQAPAALSASYTLTMPVDDGTNGQALITDGSGNLSWSTAASGDVYGPASATDNAVTRFDGTTGKLIQNSGVIIDDSNNVTGVADFTNTGNTTLGNASTDTVTVNGYGAVGTPNNAIMWRLTGSGGFNGTTQVGFGASQTGTSTGTTALIGYSSGLTTATASYTIANVYNFNASDVTKGAGSTITNQHGLYISDQTQGTNNYGITSSVSSGSNKWNIYASGTAANYFAGNVGIGTSSPASKLFVDAGNWVANTVSGVSISGSTSYIADGNWTGPLSLAWTQNSNDGSIRMLNLALSDVGTNNQTNYGLYVTGEDANYFAGSVGIGTSSPETSLTINNNTSNGVVVRSADTNCSTTDIGVSTSSAISYISASRRGTGTYQPLAFYTGGSERLRIDTSGNLGLGVTPSAWASAVKALQIGNVGTVENNNNAEFNIGTNYYRNTAGTLTYTTNGRSTSYSQNVSSGSHAWFTAPSGTAGTTVSFTQAMTLDASGRLSVGATSNIGGNTIESVSNVGVYRFTAAASGPFINLGKSRSGTIGTNTIVQDQDNLGTIAFYGANGTGYTEAAYIRSIVNGAPGASNDMPGALLFATTADGAGSATERMRIDSSGNVGIGTSSPSFLLDVRGTDPTAQVRATNASGSATLNLYGVGSNGSDLAVTQIKGVAESTGAAAALTFSTRNSAGTTAERMRLDSSGNLGLGVTPSAWTSTNKAIQVNIGAAISGDNSANAFFSSNAYQGASGWIRINTAPVSLLQLSGGGFSFYQSGSGAAGTAITFTQAMTLDATGNLGIGTAITSGKRATVYADNYPYIYFQNQFTGTTSANGFRVGYESNVGAYVDNRANTPIIFQTNATERMRIDSSGNLLVGTTTNTNSSLIVSNGTISETVGGTQYLVLSQADIGTAPNEVPVNGMLGKLAFEDVLDTVTNNPYNDTAISDVQPSLLLDFANSKTLDPRITFTRSTTATYYNGVTTAMAEQNLLTYSQEFDNAGWTKQNVAVTVNSTTAPDGTATAETFSEGTANGYHNVNQNINTTSSTYVLSVYLKYVDLQYIAIGFYKASTEYASAIFDIQNGTLSTSAASGSGYSIVGTPTITSVGNNWYRCVIIVTLPTASPLTASVAGVNGTTIGSFGLTGTFTGTSRTFYLWGAQMEQRSAVSAYTPTTSQPITNYIPALQTAAAGVPRFDHDPVTGESKGFLIEEQRTNVLTYSADFSNAAWTKTSATVTADTIVAPDGTLTGDKLVPNSGSVAAFVSVYTTGQTATVFAKMGEFRYLTITPNSFDIYSATYDLQNGVVTQFSTGYSGSSQTITPVGNGWFRCSFSFSSSTSFTFGIKPSSNPTGNHLATTVTGNGFSGIYIWGAQLEAGSFPTSYIATTSSSATRNADNASMTGTNFSSWYNQAEGSWYAESAFNSTTKNITSVIIGTNLNGNNRFIADVGTTTVLGAKKYSVGMTAVGVLGASGTPSPSWYLNGQSSNFYTNVADGAPYQLIIGAQSTTASVLNGTIKKLAYYPKRLSDAELQEMTE